MRSLSMFVVLLLVCSSVSAHEIAKTHQRSASPPSNHSIQGFVIPMLTFNSVQVGYEYKLTPRIGLRADGALILSMAGSAIAGAVSSSFIVAEGQTTSARHGLEVDIGLATGMYGGGHCNASVNECELSAEATSFTALKGFMGYRYQKHSGFQLRMGVAPFVDGRGHAFALPEITLGTTF